MSWNFYLFFVSLAGAIFTSGYVTGALLARNKRDTPPPVSLEPEAQIYVALSGLEQLAERTRDLPLAECSRCLVAAYTDGWMGMAAQVLGELADEKVSA